MWTGTKIIVIFIVSIALIFGGLYAYNMPYEQWQFLIKFGPWIIGGLFLWFLLNRIGSVFHQEETSNEPPPFDEFDPSTASQIDGHTVLMKTKRGRTFAIAKTPDGDAYIQEFTEHGQPIGPMMTGDPRLKRISDGRKFSKSNDKTRNQQIADHVKQKLARYPKQKSPYHEGHEYENREHD